MEFSPPGCCSAVEQQPPSFGGFLTSKRIWGHGRACTSARQCHEGNSSKGESSFHYRAEVTELQAGQQEWQEWGENLREIWDARFEEMDKLIDEFKAKEKSHGRNKRK
jgi:hypothetical protein